MNVDDILRHYKAGTITHDYALASITIQIERAAVMAKLDMIDKWANQTVLAMMEVDARQYDHPPVQKPGRE